MSEEFVHKSVLLRESIELLQPSHGEVFLDVTLGLGGHAALVLQAIGDGGTLLAVDADPENLETAKNRLQTFPGIKKYHHANFIELPHLGFPQVDGIFADLGMSSVHIDDATKGFTYHKEAPLDLRYDRTAGPTASELLQAKSEDELADILYQFGEIRQSRKLSASIKQVLPKTTTELRKVLDNFFGYKAKNFYAQVFQSLRIAVNRELEALQVLLDVGPTLLKPNGRMAIISFHSLEDRMVKQAFKNLCTPQIHDQTGQIVQESEWQILTKKPITPSSEECDDNPRARSAKMRGIQRKSMV